MSRFSFKLNALVALVLLSLFSTFAGVTASSDEKANHQPSSPEASPPYPLPDSHDHDGYPHHSGFPNTGYSTQCKHIYKRKEWRNMLLKEKRDYIEAVKCLQSKPATTSFQGVRTRFDDFQALHINLAEVIHAVGQFLGWHRQFLFVYEKALREECGYQGTQPYWNWSEDTDDIIKAPVFDAHTGFGGNGVDGTYPDVFGINPSQNTNRSSGWGGGCVKDGPFASYEVALGPGKLINDHCLVRGIRQDFTQFVTYEAVANATKQPTFELFRIELEGMPITPTHKMHDGGHLVVGGEMQNLYSSPADPLFYLHHANLDRIWWEWQAVNFTDRLYQVSGRSTVPPPWVNITLDFPLDMGTLGETVPIRDAMDIRQAPLCYIYV